MFDHGVASGDPAPDGATLWTRLSTSSSTGDEPVRWQVAEDRALRRTVVSGTAPARAAADWTVSVRLRDPRLRPATTYWYRFAALGAVSRVGRLRTLPDPDAPLDRLRVGFVSCQDHTAGRFSALGRLADVDVDVVLHLGDAIYESVGDPAFQGRGPRDRRLRLPSGRVRAETLDDYRWLWRAYRADPDLQRFHAAHTVVAIWDDHEFANDGYGVHDTDTLDERANRDPARRSAASRAWTEYQPADVVWDGDADPVDQVRIHRAFAFGDLAEVVLTDERLYRDGPPCGLARRDRYATRGCPEVAAPGRTMLGARQRAWFVDRVTTSSRRWKLWANETMVMPLRLPGWLARLVHPEAGPTPADRPVHLNLDQWDGYVAERERLAAALLGVDGLVVLTGDLHSFITGTWRAASGAPVAPCLMTGSVSSANLVELIAGRTLPSLPLPLAPLLRAANPHLRSVNSSAHGFTLLDVTPEQVRCTMRAVAGIRRGPAWTWTVGRATVDHGSRVPRA